MMKGTPALIAGRREEIINACEKLYEDVKARREYQRLRRTRLFPRVRRQTVRKGEIEIKRILPILMLIALVLGLAACGGKTGPEKAETPSETTLNAGTDEETANEPTEAAAQPEQTEAAAGQKTLVVVFSATGTTKGVAEKIAEIENADLYEIKAAQEYTSDDLNWNDSSSRSTLEQNDKNARPEIGSEPISLAGYEKIYIGYPIWWGEEPRIMDTFVESYRFDGITVIPFCTSGGSGIGRSGQNLADHAGSGKWLEGKRFSGSVAEADLQSWIDSLK